MAATKKTIFFEQVLTVHFPVLLFYLWRGYEIYVFDFTLSLKRSWWLRGLINSGRLKRLYVFSLGPLHGQAIDQTEIIYAKQKQGGLQRCLASLFGTNETDLVFKKALVRDIFLCLYVNDYLSGKSDETGKLCFIPVHYLVFHRMVARHGTFSLRAWNATHVPFWSVIVSIVARFFELFFLRIGGFCYLTSKLFCLTVGKVAAKAQQQDERFRYVVALHQLFEIKFINKRSFDFLLDHNVITKENTLFFLDMVVDNAWLSSRKQQGYQFFCNRGWEGVKNLLTSRCSGKDIVKIFNALMRVIVSFGEPRSFVQAHLFGVNIFISYQALLNRYRFRQYIYMNQETPAQIAVNIFMRLHERQTWNYTFSIGADYLYAKNPEEFSRYRNILWAFLNSDHFTGISQYLIDYHKLHVQQVRHYHLVGSMYASMVNDVMHEATRESLAKNYFKAIRPEQKTISFFDTSFIDFENAATTVEDALCFYADILRLLNEMSDILVIVKSSKSEDFFVEPEEQWSSPEKGKKVIELWDRLKNHKRVYWAGHAGDMPAIMAASDVVVTHCFSSPSTEALGARKKAFWYESCQRHRGLLYDQIPGLVAHGFEELKTKITDLLYRISDQEYAAYLDAHIKGRVEPFLDGLALTRFRTLLTQ